MINWPCIFKLEGDNELMFMSTELELHSECDSLIWSDSDVLIDSAGQSYLLFSTEGEKLQWLKRERLYDLQEITALIQAHEFSQAQMCLTKIQFGCIESAISSLS